MGEEEENDTVLAGNQKDSENDEVCYCRLTCYIMWLPAVVIV